jgi:hypothetical protein
MDIRENDRSYACVTITGSDLNNVLVPRLVKDLKPGDVSQIRAACFIAVLMA